MCKKEKSGSVSIKAGPPSTNSYFASYPVFSIGTDGQGLVITGGGGGGKSYGVLNYLQAHVVIQDASSRALTMETIATLDTGPDAAIAIDYLDTQGGVWICALGNHCLLFKFNDDTLAIEPLFKFKSELSGNDLHVTNFVKLHASQGVISILTGGEDKVVRLWQVRQESGQGSKITHVDLVTELADHKAEVVDADWQMTGNHFLTCGKDGSVKVWQAYNQQLVCTIQPRSLDKKNETVVSIRSAFFVAQNDVVILCHHPRGPAYLMLYSLANPTSPVSALAVSKTITPSMAINATRTRVAISHAGGEKDIVSVPGMRMVGSMRKHSHEMPPGKTIFVFENLIVSASPDFSLNFFDPLKRSNALSSLCMFVLWLVLLLLIVTACIAVLVPDGQNMVLQQVRQIEASIRGQEL